MAHQIIWSLQARDDLREIVAYIAADNPTVAESFGYQLMAKVDLLAKFPQLGRVVPEESNENIRERFFDRIESFTKSSLRSKSSPSPASGTARGASRKFQADWNSNLPDDGKRHAAGAQRVETRGRRLHRDVVVLRLIRQRHEADEASCASCKCF